MYHEGKSYAEIEEATGISRGMVHHYTRKAKVRRKDKNKNRRGRPSTYSEEFKQTCLSLLEEGKTTSQVEEIMGVSRGTVRRWQKKAEKTQERDQ
jgi:transposase